MEFLSVMQRPSGCSEVAQDLDQEHFRKFGKKQAEKTSSLPSGGHYGHMRVCASDDEVNSVVFDIIDMAYRNKVMLRRWCTVHNILLRKDNEGSRIHRMRNILIIEGDLQYIMKEVWARRLLSNADLLLLDLQNTKKQKVAQSAVLNHRLGLDLNLAMHSEAIIVINDAVNCYDRINLELAALSMIRMQMVVASAIFFLTMLQSMNHFLVLGSLIMEGYLFSMEREPLDGCGQGAGWSPVSWRCVFDTVLSAIRKYQLGVLYKSSNGEFEDQRDVEGFVDDSNQGLNSEGIRKYNQERGRDLTLGEAALQSNQSFEQYLSIT